MNNALINILYYRRVTTHYYKYFLEVIRKVYGFYIQALKTIVIFNALTYYCLTFLTFGKYTSLNLVIRKMETEIYKDIIAVLKQIPKGKVSTYGRIAIMAGYKNGARQVAWFLHNSSKKERLPWHRVLNSQGKIALNSPEDQLKQLSLLMSEGIEVNEHGRVDFNTYLWAP